MSVVKFVFIRLSDVGPPQRCYREVSVDNAGMRVLSRILALL